MSIYETEQQYGDLVVQFGRSEGYDYRSDPSPSEVLPTGARVLFSDDDYEEYTGAALVVFEVNGVLYEVNGSHCSCYGFEGQWSPEVASIKELRQRAQRQVERGQDDYYPYLDWARLVRQLDAWVASR